MPKPTTLLCSCILASIQLACLSGTRVIMTVCVLATIEYNSAPRTCRRGQRDSEDTVPYTSIDLTEAGAVRDDDTLTPWHPTHWQCWRLQLLSRPKHTQNMALILAFEISAMNFRSRAFPSKNRMRMELDPMPGSVLGAFVVSNQ